jgi:hypothetical protein
MGAREATHEYRLRRWIEMISQCRNSGMTVKAWCESQNINVKSYYYWQKRVREVAGKSFPVCHQSVEEAAAGIQPVFTELALQKTKFVCSTAVIIRYHDASIEIQNGADSAVIQNALRAIKSIC